MAFLRRIDFILYLVIVYTLLYILLNIICIYNNEHFIEKSYSSNMATNRQQFEYIVINLFNCINYT